MVMVRTAWVIQPSLCTVATKAPAGPRTCCQGTFAKPTWRTHRFHAVRSLVTRLWSSSASCRVCAHASIGDELAN
eukprot:9475354-Pyramimonas_sp.AAC.1